MRRGLAGARAPLATLTAALMIALGAGAWASDAGSADAPTVAVRVDRSDARVGDVVNVTVTAVSARTVPVNLPAQLDLGPFALLDRKESEKDLGDGRVRREFALQIAAYEPGEQTLPPVELTYIGVGGAVLTVKGDAVKLRVTSVLANEPNPDLKDNAGPVAVLEDNRYLIMGLAALGVLVLGAVIGVVVWRRMRARAVQRPAPPPRPPHEVALDRLDRLGAAGFLEHADYRPFYFSLSEIVRDYLGGRFGFDSLELTTEELVAELRQRAGREMLLSDVEGWLAGCDLVKFAKISPTAAEARGAFEQALRIVSVTRPRPDPQVTPGSVPMQGEAPGA